MVGINGWMVGRKEWMDECNGSLDVWMVGMDGKMNECMKGMVKWMDGWKDGCIYGWMNG